MKPCNYKYGSLPKLDDFQKNLRKIKDFWDHE